jgi:integrase/recombinase XerD
MKEMFSSRLAPKMYDFLEFKHALGYKYTTGAFYLRSFDIYCISHGNPYTLAKETVEGWIQQKEENRDCPDRSWISPMREFGRYLRSIGEQSAYVVNEKYIMNKYRPQNYLLTENEIQAFFKACDEQVLKKNHQGRHLVMPVFFRFLCCCGVRCCEARVLKVQDAHLDEGYIDIKQSKAFRDRRLYLSDELTSLLKRYNSEVAKYFQNRVFFFPSTTGGCYSSGSISTNFNIFWDAARLQKDGPVKPRAYDFRHHFAFANINRWTAEGKDVHAMLPYLMRYMGHSSFDSTLYYIHLSPDFYSDYESMASISDSCIPEVVTYEV